jgi:hypothetical protein
VFYITGKASNSAAKDAVWNALGAIDSSYTATDINIDVQVSGLAAGASLTVATMNLILTSDRNLLRKLQL